MSVANHLTPLDLKLIEQPGLTPEQQATFGKAYAEENKKLEEAKLEGRERTQVELSAVREGLPALRRCGR